MNIRLIPYNWIRHFSVGLFCAGLATIAWWVVLHWLVLMGGQGTIWKQFYEGVVILTVLAVTIGCGTVAAESILRRRPVPWMMLLVFVAGLCTFLCTGLGVYLVDLSTFMLGQSMEGTLENPVMGGPATLALRYKILDWIVVGIGAALGALTARLLWHLILKLRARFEEKIPSFIALPDEHSKMSWLLFYNHIVGGLAAALISAAVWHLFNHNLTHDLYYASAFSFMTMGFLFGCFVWGIPPDLYAGWIRILSHHRFGHRIPILALDGGHSERFFGHFPRGLDVFVEAEHGVQEIHASFVGDKAGNYAVRGLSQSPTSLKRFLERIDLSYDPLSPVPLEAGLSMEDLVYMGPPNQQTIVEFLFLPKEEE